MTLRERLQLFFSISEIDTKEPLINPHMASRRRLFSFRARHADRSVFDIHQWRRNNAMDENSPVPLINFKLKAGCSVKSSDTALQSLPISTYELRFAPCLRRFDGQREVMGGQSEVP